MLIKINIRIKVKVGILCATAKLLGLISLEIRPQIIVKRPLKYFSIYVKKFCISGSKTIEHKCSNEMLKRNFMNFQSLRRLYLWKHQSLQQDALKYHPTDF